MVVSADLQFDMLKPVEVESNRGSSDQKNKLLKTGTSPWDVSLFIVRSTKLVY